MKFVIATLVYVGLISFVVADVSWLWNILELEQAHRFFFLFGLILVNLGVFSWFTAWR